MRLQSQHRYHDVLAYLWRILDVLLLRLCLSCHDLLNVTLSMSSADLGGNVVALSDKLRVFVLDVAGHRDFVVLDETTEM